MPRRVSQTAVALFVVLLLGVPLVAGLPEPFGAVAARAQDEPLQERPEEATPETDPPESAPPDGDLPDEFDPRLETEEVTAPREVLVEDGAEGSGGDGPPDEVGGETGAAPTPPPRVVAVEVRADAALDRRGEVESLVALAPGEPFTELAVRQTLRNLQAAGLAYDVRVATREATAAEVAAWEATRAREGSEGDRRRGAEDANETDEADDSASGLPGAAAAGPGDAPPVVAVVSLWTAIQVSSVELTGELGLDRRELEDEILVRPGLPLVDGPILRSVYALDDLYERRGWFDATVRLEVDVDEEAKRAAVTFRVDAGERWQVGRVEFDGELGPFARERLLDPLRADPGDGYSARVLSEDRERLLEWLYEEGHRTAEVEAVEETRRPEARRVDLLWRLRVGPVVEVRVDGGDLDDLEDEDLLPFLGRQGYDEALVVQATDRIERWYQSQGHWRVEVESSEERTEERILVRFTIDEGPVFTLRSLSFEGNRTFSDERLGRLVETAPRQTLVFGSGRLVPAVLEEDVDNLTSFYVLQGFHRVRVGPAEVTRDGTDLAVTIPIEEGPRRRVVSLAWQGAEAFSEAELDRLVAGGDAPPGSPQALSTGLDEGRPFHELRLEDALDEVRGFYEDRGYLSVQVSARQEWNPEDTLVDLTIQIIEGPRTRVGRVVVRGNTRTRLEVIEDALDLERGSPVSPAELLAAQRRLYRLGVFSRADVEFAPRDLADQTRDVIVRVEEGRTQRISYGVGYDTDDGLGGILGYSHSNVLGRAWTFQADLRYRSNRRLARLVFDQPGVGDWGLPILYTIGYEDEDRNAYTVRRSIGRVEILRQTRRRRMGVILDYRQVDSTLAPTDTAEEIERQDQDIQISSLIPNILLDERDDPVDPTRGWSLSGRVQYAFPVDGLTDADFLKLFGQATGFLDLGPGLVGASVRLGAIEPFSAAGPDFDVPIDERFFAGGDFSHRAYSRDQLFIPGETARNRVEQGGNGLVLVNLDYRLPVWGDLWGEVFVDTGNVWADWRDVTFGELKTGVGLGLRYRSPIGPVRAGAAYKLDPEPFEDEWRLYLALGNAF